MITGIHLASCLALALLGIFFSDNASAHEVTAVPAGGLTQASQHALQSEIVVTALRRAEQSVDVPITVTTLGFARLAIAEIHDLADISKITQSFQVDSTVGVFQSTISGIATLWLYLARAQTSDF